MKVAILIATWELWTVSSCVISRCRTRNIVVTTAACPVCSPGTLLRFRPRRCSRRRAIGSENLRRRWKRPTSGSKSESFGRGGVTFKRNQETAQSLLRFFQGLALPGVQLFSLQKGPPEREYSVKARMTASGAKRTLANTPTSAKCHERNSRQLFGAL
jgi:hypothetical protein